MIQRYHFLCIRILFVLSLWLHSLDAVQENMANLGVALAFEHPTLLPYYGHPQYRAVYGLFLEACAYQKKNEAFGILLPSAGKKTSAQFSLLKERLLFFHCIDNPASTTKESLVAGIKKFQRAQNIAVTGRLDKTTLELLNTPLQDFIDLLSFTLLEWKKMGQYSAYPHLIVNIPQFIIHGIQYENTSFQSVVVVGKNIEKNRTPITHDSIKSVVTYPFWFVPQSQIARLSPLAKNESSQYFWKDGYLAQKPGLTNSLGIIKFMFEHNKNGILMHSTNKPHLFQRRNRADSLGCVRIKDYKGLLAFMSLSTQWHDKVMHALTGKKTEYFMLPISFPLYIGYFPIWVNKEGVPVICPDVYDYFSQFQKKKTSMVAEKNLDLVPPLDPPFLQDLMAKGKLDLNSAVSEKPSMMSSVHNSLIKKDNQQRQEEEEEEGEEEEA